jgi:gliding motility-associated protein GldE
MDDPYSSFHLLGQINAPTTSYLIINGFIFILLLMGSALVSGSEVAFFSLSNEDLNQIDEENSVRGKKVLQLVASPKNLLSTILILNNLINIGIVTLTTFVAWSIFGVNNAGIIVILVQTIGVTFAIVFFGEIVPKVYANKAKIAFSLVMAPTISFFSTILKPISIILMAFSNLIEKRIEKKAYSLSVNELNRALDLSTEDAPNEEKDILRGIVNFGTLTVKQVMMSRMDITAIDMDIDFHELMDKINKSGYSRIPVYEETIDNIRGILYIKDLLPFIERDEDFKWNELIRSSFFVPENKKVDTLLKDFQQKRVHMAIVVDEYGGTSGLVTLEDLIEEIIGEINDEFDDADDIYFQEIDPSTFIFEGKVSLNDFCKKLDLDSQIFDNVKGENESLAGLLLELNSKLPKNGTKIIYDEFTFTILAVDARKIKKVKVQIASDKKDNIGLYTD